MKAILGIMLLFFVAGCDKYRHHEEPFNEFRKVGFLGHGEGFVGELRLNLWNIDRPCDSCHAVSPTIHPALESCNSCHQPHPEGWERSTVALYHNESLPLAGRFYHSDLDCKECHSSIKSRVEYKQMQCLHCHSHNKGAIQDAHQWLDGFVLESEYDDLRCLACHSKTGREYLKYYNPETNELL